jgi:hypothetical protein
MRKISIALGTLILTLFCCERENVIPDNENSRLRMVIGTACGWCAGTDSLVITKDSVIYKFISPCDNNDYTTDSVTNPNDWNDLVNLLDTDEFTEIDINTCYVCVDGCDTWISVKGDSISHKIRFGHRDSIAVQNIRPFINKLDSIRNGFRMGMDE